MMNVYDDEGNVVWDDVRREKLLLLEEAERISSFLDDVNRELDVESNGVGDFGSVVQRLEHIRANDPDMAPEVERFLNRAAAIELDVLRHKWYIDKKHYPIDVGECFSL